MEIIDFYIERAWYYSKIRGGYGLTQSDLKKAQEDVKRMYQQLNSNKI